MLPDRRLFDKSCELSLRPITGDDPDEMFRIIDLKPRDWLSLIDLKSVFWMENEALDENYGNLRWVVKILAKFDRFSDFFRFFLKVLEKFRFFLDFSVIFELFQGFGFCLIIFRLFLRFLKGFSINFWVIQNFSK